MLKRAIAAIVLTGLTAVPVSGAVTRQFGVDVSSFQGTINWTQVADGTFDGGKSVDFAFIRSSRGASGLDPTYYKDPRYDLNIAQAKAAGLMVAPYHFARPDLWDRSAGSMHSGVKEAQWFMSVAGSAMTKGYLRPVLDLEAGATKQRVDSSGRPVLDADGDPIFDNYLTTTELTNWALEFCAEIVRVKGFDARPIIYMNSNYAKNEISGALSNPALGYDLWLARPDEDSDPIGGDPIPPSDSYPTPYGTWYKGSTDPDPWAVWQYYIPDIDPTYLANGTYIHVPGIPTKVDLDVVQSERKSLQALLVPEPGGVMVAVLVGGLGLIRRRA